MDVKNLGSSVIKDADKMLKRFLRFSAQTVGSNMYQFLSKKKLLKTFVFESRPR